MQFVKTEDLKPGMRLAKPVYNKNGVLLYDRNSKLTLPGINSISNFGLIGIYILEPAEPLPPLSREDIEFEQSQTIFLFKLREAYDQIKKRKKMDNFHLLVQDIESSYGTLNHRVNFNQNLRSADDFVYKHSISTAILSALIGHTMNLSHSELSSLIAASLLFDFGYQFVPRPIIEKGNDLVKDDEEIIWKNLERGLSYLDMYKTDFGFMPKAHNIIQYYIMSQSENNTLKNPDESLLKLADILRVADNFDLMTGMNIGHKPESEIMAMRHLEQEPDFFNEEVVSALAASIHIVPMGASVDLSTGDKGIVLEESPEQYIKPLILRISNNQIYDLSNPTISRHIHIIDIMKTMDNRIEIDEETLKHFKADTRIIETTNKFRKAFGQNKNSTPKDGIRI